MDDRPQRLIANRYLLGPLLGSGGMGTVWRAQDRLLGRDVAIKQVEAHDPIQPGQPGDTLGVPARARVLREARAAARLNHPGAVTIHDIVEDDRYIYIVMELVSAPTLAALVEREGPLPPARVAGIGEQLLDVLLAAHDAGIVHRDVKPANVMVLPRDRVKLADFGIAALHGDPQLTRPGTVLGSPGFLAPEQAEGAPAGPEADLWALGATLYFALEGRGPYTRDSTAAVIAALLSQPPDPMHPAGPLGPVVTALLDRVPQRRPAGDRLHAMLRQAISADSTTAAGAAPVRPAAMPVQPLAPIPAPAPRPPYPYETGRPDEAGVPMRRTSGWVLAG